MGDFATEALDWQLWLWFARAHRAVIDRIDASFGTATALTTAQFELLHILYAAAGSMRSIDITRVTLLSESSVSRQIDRLSDAGLVVRKGLSQDARAIRAQLTRDGLARYAAAVGPFRQAIDRQFVGRIAADHADAFRTAMVALEQDPDFAERRSAIILAARASPREDGDLVVAVAESPAAIIPADRWIWLHFLRAHKVALDGLEDRLGRDALVTPGEFEILRTLATTAQQLRPSQIADAVLFSRSRISRQLRLLQDKGFVRTLAARDDGRSSHVTLTAMGEQAYGRALAAFADFYLTGFVSLLGAEGMQTLRATLPRLLAD